MLSMGWVLAALAFADDEHYLAIKDQKCELVQFSKKTQKFKVTAKNLNKLLGRTLIGRPLANEPLKTAFWIEGDPTKTVYATSTACLGQGEPYGVPVNTEALAAAKEVSETQSRPSAPLEIPTHVGRQYYYLRLFSWQETARLTRSSDSVKFPLMLTMMGGSVGYGRHLYERSRLELIWDSSFDWGYFEKGYKTYNATAPSIGDNYKPVWGFTTGPKAIWHLSNDFAVGLNVPLGYRKAKLASVPTGYKYNAENIFYAAALIETHFVLDDWVIVQKAGVIKAWPNYFLGFEFSHNF
jgi:hypothetical protein